MTPRLPHMLLAVSATILAACSTPSGTSTEKAAMLEHEQLAGAAWQVQQLNGQPVTNATLTLNFHEPGKLAGKAACNNYMASYEQLPSRFSIQTGGMTMKACPPPLMDLEKQFMKALKSIDSATIDDQGTLLLSGKGVEIKATR